MTVAADGGPTTAGVDGEVPLVARGSATKLAVDTQGADGDLTGLAVEDDFAGRLYDAPLSGPDAVYVHRDGAYTTEVRDADDAVGAFRVVPTDEATIRIDEPRTGKASLASFLADVAEETRAEVAGIAATGGTTTATAVDAGSVTEDDGNVEVDAVTADAAWTDVERDLADAAAAGRGNAVCGLSRALAAIADAARRAAERADAGDRAGADRSLAGIHTALDRVAERLAAARGALPDGVARAMDRRLDQAQRRTEQALDSEKL